MEESSIKQIGTCDTDNIALLYNQVYDELNRGRDWPLKIIGVMSTLFAGIIGSARIAKEFSTGLNMGLKAICIGILIIYGIYTAIVVWRQHKNYLKYRDVQRKLQNSFGFGNLKTVDGKSVLLPEWTDEKYKKKSRNHYGVFYYISFITILTGFAIYLIYII
jgi:hypothetical protein